MPSYLPPGIFQMIRYTVFGVKIGEVKHIACRCQSRAGSQRIGGQREKALCQGASLNDLQLRKELPRKRKGHVAREAKKRFCSRIQALAPEICHSLRLQPASRLRLPVDLQAVSAA
jgi:hypothetical protein